MGVRLPNGALQSPYYRVVSVIETRVKCKVFGRKLVRGRVREKMIKALRALTHAHIAHYIREISSGFRRNLMCTIEMGTANSN